MNKKEKREQGIDKKTIGLQKYRRKTLNLIVILLFLSIWTTMINNIDWKFSDIAMEMISLIIIAIVGMFSNVDNGFPLFHFRRLRMTHERLVSVLIGLFFPLVFILYIMVTNNNFMKYIGSISLHNFITLATLACPVVILISLVIYIGYIILEPRSKRKKEPRYKDEIEMKLDSYKKTTLNLLTTTSLISIWIKIGFNQNWIIENINTEIILLIIIAVMKIVGNVDNKLAWNYCENKKLDKQFYFTLSIPYILVFLFFLVSTNFRDKVLLIGFKGLISILVCIFPIILLVALLLYFASKTSNKKFLKEAGKSLEKREENIIITLSITLISLVILFIYIINFVIEVLTMQILSQIIILLIPLGVIIYLVLYYSLIDINK